MRNMESVGLSRHRVRYESFGGILSSTDPPFLAWVDRTFLRDAGYEESPLWHTDDPGYLSAPTEAHFSITEKCSSGCAGCYMDSCGETAVDLSLEEVKAVLDTLRAMGVFHVALGGGEAFERPDFEDIAAYCREIGLVPNLTTNGQRMGDREIGICRMMGQVNVSLDGLESHYGVNGRAGSFERADQALRKLRAAGIAAGINCVVSVKNYSHIKDIAEYACTRGLAEIEFLKYKPSGRAKDRYPDFALSQEMIRSFYPRIQEIAASLPVEIKIDCSFIPAMMYHHPPLEELEKWAVAGCDGGNMLLGIRSSGVFSACSFISNNDAESALSLKTHWHTSAHLSRFRRWTQNPPEPCASCTYLTICRGGCRAVALYYNHDFSSPDPECPFVYDYMCCKGALK